MRCPTLSELPHPPPGRAGWPWTEESPQLPDTMPGGVPWPRVTIVTPSYSQATFVEETIRSVLLQDYPNLEYVVIDGGSTDGSLDVIRRYQPWLAHWVTEPDRGQADAINKGFRMTKGQICAWLNSDDLYYGTHAVSYAVEALRSEPHIGMVYGDCLVVDRTGTLIDVWYSESADLDGLLFKNRILQPTAFLRREALEQVGFLDARLHFAMDYDLWLRIAARFPIRYLSRSLAVFRLHADSKTIASFASMAEEYEDVARRCFQGDACRWPSSVRKKFLAGPRIHEADVALRFGYARLARTKIVEALRLWPLGITTKPVSVLLLKLLLGEKLRGRGRALRARSRIAAVRNSDNHSASVM